jgi:hypothetical protein
MKKRISLLIGCSLAVAGALYAQQPDSQASPSATVEGPKHGGPSKPAATDESQTGGQGGNRKSKELAGGAGQQEGESPAPGSGHKQKHHKKHHTDAGDTGSATSNKNGPDASLSPSSDQTARSGGAVVPRPSASPTP